MNMKNYLLIAIIIILFAATGALAWYALTEQRNPEPQKLTPAQTSGTVTDPSTIQNSDQLPASEEQSTRETTLPENLLLSEVTDIPQSENENNNNSQENILSKPAPPEIDESEVTRRNTPQECWIIFDQEVYNLTPIADQYPEGATQAFTLCGSDVTDLFLDQNLPPSFYSAMSENRQGDLSN